MKSDTDIKPTPPGQELEDFTDCERERNTLVGLVSNGLEIVDPEPAVELPSICPVCESHSETIARRRLNTKYADEESNWLVSCAQCWEDAIEHFNEQWREYHAGQGV